jgi:DNA invertase Pin-like site-specific DNA recombinase
MQDAVSYKRFSTPKQGWGDSNRRQTDLAADYCKRHGLRLIDTYLDAGLSGYTGAHLGDGGALRALLEAAKAGKFRRDTYLIVESLDRLSRQEISTAVRLFLDILDTGLVIVTLIDGEQVFTKKRVNSEMTALIIAIVILQRANNESRTRTERVKQAKAVARQKAREQKIPLTTLCPVWLTVSGRGDNRRFVVNIDRARIIERIFRLARSGNGTFRISQILNAEGAPTFNDDQKWRHTRVASLLTSRAVVGEYQPCLYLEVDGRKRRVPDPEGPIKDYYPPIISEFLFSEVQTARQRRRPHDEFCREWTYANLVSRIGRCGVCGGTLYQSGNRQLYSYLRCVNSQYKDCPNTAGFPYIRLESMLLVLDDLTELVAVFAAQKSNHSPVGRIAGLEADIVRARKSLRKLVFAFSNMTGPASQAATGRIESLNTEIQRKESELADIERELRSGGFATRKRFSVRFQAAKATANSSDPQERQLARAALAGELRQVVEAVVLHSGRIATVHLRPDAAECQIAYILDPDGIHGVRVKADNRLADFIRPSALLNFEPEGPNGRPRLPKADRLLMHTTNSADVADGVAFNPAPMMEILAHGDYVLRSAHRLGIPGANIGYTYSSA